MSSIWTPGGERPVNRGGGADADPAGGDPGAQGAHEQEELERELQAMQEELAKAPASVVVANHAVGLFQLAAIHLNRRPPQLEDGRLAIDALAGLLDATTGRVGDDESALRQGLDQLRMAFVQLADSFGTDEPDS